MALKTKRTTVTLPAQILAAVDRVVAKGAARSRNAYLAAALRNQLEADRRAAIDAAFAEMANDEDFRRDAETLAESFAASDWEAFTIGETKA